MADALAALKERAAELTHLEKIGALLDWDLNTYMPTGGSRARAEQLGTISKIAHEMLTSDDTRRRLEAAEAASGGLDLDSDDARLIRVFRRDFDKAVKIPTELQAEISRHAALSHEIWKDARAKSNFAAFQPSLEKTIELSRRVADHLGYDADPYDALLDQYEPGMKTAEVAAIFDDLKPRLVALNHAIAGAPQPDATVLAGHFPTADQSKFTLEIVKLLGYDLTRGRQDVTAHPFCTNFSCDDVRITTRYDESHLEYALYASLHEAGHAMYEQGSPREFGDSPLAGGAAMGVHESQSRLWENLVGRSRAFATFIVPKLRAAFPDALARLQEEAYYRAVNRVHPSFIRVEADEVTYNLHVLLRFELERAMLSGSISIADMPEAWNARMQQYLGITPPDDARGVLQDVHWSGGMLGYFPTYTLGTLLSGQLWHAMEQDLGDLDAKVAAGEFAPILGWLREKVHRHGRKYLPGELIPMATGEPLTAKYYMDYLTRKYTELYGL